MKKWVRTAVATTAIAATISGLGSQAYASTYKVSSGDTLWKIALDNQTSVNHIKQLNSLSSDIIFPNQVLKLSGEAAVTSSNSGSTTSVSASSYIVKSGDTLYGIALKTNTSVSSIRSLNNLSSHLIYPGQSLKLEGTVHTSSNSTNVSSSSSSNTSTYTVKSGDSLSRIAANHGISLSHLMNLNGISGYLIYPGQTLKVTGTASNVSSGPAQTSHQQTAGNTAIVQKAKAQIGTPYVWGGASTSGFDCSGFISYVFNTSRTSAAGYYSRSSHVSSPQVGDLVFFKNTYKAGISHVGIYVGGNQFVHAGNNGVEVTSLSNSYWSSKFDSFRSF